MISLLNFHGSRFSGGGDINVNSGQNVRIKGTAVKNIMVFAGGRFLLKFGRTAELVSVTIYTPSTCNLRSICK